jgi:cytochrome c oxidase assembly protein subunit 15
MKKYFRFSIASILFTYLLIFVGGLVRVSGAGMGCPDWPKCFGRWIPPTNINQLPDYIDPEKFNLVLAWVEYVNRLFGVLVGSIILISCVFAVLHFKNYKKVTFSILLALFLTLVEGWLGSKLVDTVLDPITITIHLLLALIIIGLIIYSSMQSYLIINGNFEKNSFYPDSIKYMIMAIMGCVVIEIIVGTEIRGGLDISRKDNPLIESLVLLKMLGPFKYIHTILGLILLAVVYYLRKVVTDTKSYSSSIMIYATNAMLVIIGIQIILGESLVFFDVKPIVQLFHMWFSSLFLGLSIVQYTCWEISNS